MNQSCIILIILYLSYSLGQIVQKEISPQEVGKFIPVQFENAKDGVYYYYTLQQDEQIFINFQNPANNYYIYQRIQFEQQIKLKPEEVFAYQSYTRTSVTCKQIVCLLEISFKIQDEYGNKIVHHIPEGNGAYLQLVRYASQNSEHFEQFDPIEIQLFNGQSYPAISQSVKGVQKHRAQKILRQKYSFCVDLQKFNLNIQGYIAVSNQYFDQKNIYFKILAKKFSQDEIEDLDAYPKFSVDDYQMKHQLNQGVYILPKDMDLSQGYLAISVYVTITKNYYYDNSAFLIQVAEFSQDKNTNFMMEYQDNQVIFGSTTKQIMKQNQVVQVNLLPQQIDHEYILQVYKSEKSNSRDENQGKLVQTLEFDKRNFSTSYEFLNNEIGCQYYFISFPKFTVKEELELNINYSIENDWNVMD